MIGKQVHHYKILEKPRSGGVGGVYLAEDTKLERKVALKFISENLTADEDFVKRYEREAKAIAKLNHTNIVTIHELGEFESKLYAALEYIERQSLDKLIKNESLSIEDTDETIFLLHFQLDSDNLKV